MLDYAAKCTTPPTSEPVTVAEAKRNANVVADDDDDLIASLIKTARELVESDSNRSLMTQTWTMSLQMFPVDKIELPRPPLVSVTSIKYYDLDDVQQTIPPTYYAVDTLREPGVIWRDEDAVWPVINDDVNPIEIIYQAGYGAAAAVPQRAKQAILMLVAHWYRCREAVGRVEGEIQLAYERLIRSLKPGNYP